MASTSEHKYLYVIKDKFTVTYIESDKDHIHIMIDYP